MIIQFNAAHQASHFKNTHRRLLHGLIRKEAKEQLKTHVYEKYPFPVFVQD